MADIFDAYKIRKIHVYSSPHQESWWVDKNYTLHVNQKRLLDPNTTFLHAELVDTSQIRNYPFITKFAHQAELRGSILTNQAIDESGRHFGHERLYSSYKPHVQEVIQRSIHTNPSVHGFNIRMEPDKFQAVVKNSIESGLARYNRQDGPRTWQSSVDAVKSCVETGLQHLEAATEAKLQPKFAENCSQEVAVDVLVEAEQSEAIEAQVNQEQGAVASVSSPEVQGIVPLRHSGVGQTTPMIGVNPAPPVPSETSLGVGGFLTCLGLQVGFQVALSVPWIGKIVIKLLGR